MAAPPQESLPLVMENADHLEGVRSTGEYILKGNVRFRHGELRFETQRALWQRAQNRVSCEEGMRITHRGALLTSDRGNYDKAANKARAEGRVFLRDSSGEVSANSERLDYDRIRRLSVLTGKPVARRIYPAQAADSATGIRARAADTLVIRGDKLRYNDSTGVAAAEGNVIITRRDLRITCGSAEYLQKQDSLILRDHPVARVEDSEIRGLVIRMGLDGEELRGMRVRGDAEALSFEKATDTSRARQSRIAGDSLSLAFLDGGIDSVEVFEQAEGTYWEIEKPDYVNRMRGDYMVMRFRDRQAREAFVLGSARSTYYHFDRDSLKGRNQAEGDEILLGFSDGKIEDILVKGTAKGVYEGRGQVETSGDVADTAGTTGTTDTTDSREPSRERKEKGTP